MKTSMKTSRTDLVMFWDMSMEVDGDIPDFVTTLGVQYIYMSSKIPEKQKNG